MFFTVKQYSHIRGRTCISCHVQSAYLPMPPSTPQGSVSAGLPLTLVNVCVWLWGGVVWCGEDADWPALSSLISAAVCLWLCGEIDGLLLLWVCPSPIPAPVGLLLPNQTFHSSQWCLLTKVCMCGHSHIHLLACLTVYLLISSPGSSLLAHFSISLSGCSFLWLPPYLLSWLSPYLQNKLRFQLLDESCSYSELWPALHNHSKTKSVVNWLQEH